MSKLYFRIGADFDKVIKLREEIAKLKNELKNMDSSQSPAAFNALNTQLAASTKQLDGLVTKAAQAGAEVESGFKKKIFDASQSVNGFTEKIIAQKAVVKDVEADVKRLGGAYRVALKNSPLSANSKLSEYNSAKKILDEEKAALFGLTQEQANARLSVKKLRDEYALYKNDGKQVIETTNGIAISWKKALGVIGGVTAIKKFISDLVNVRGEFQKTQMSFETMLGSKEKADKLMAQMVETAAKTPFDLQGVANGAKQLLAYGTEAENVNDTLIRLGNIASGLSIPLGDMVYLYGTTQTQGRLFTQDVRQFMGRGIPLVKELATMLGKTEEEINKMVTAGQIGFHEVEKVIKKMTDEGGKFYNLMQKQSETLSGQISNLGDAWDRMLNSIGEDTQGLTSKTISMATSLVENYETVGKVLAGLIVTYGTYRTAVMLVTAAESRHTLVEIGLTNARVLARKAQLALNAAMLTNPYVLLATAVVGLGAAMWAFHDSSTEAEKAQKRFNERQEEAQKLEQEHKQKIDSLVDSSRDIALSDLQRGQSLAELRKEYPKIFAKYDLESIKLADILKLKQQINEEDGRRKEESKKQELSDIESEISRIEKFLSTTTKKQGVDGMVKKLQDLRNDRDILLQEKGKGISEQFISTFKDIDISEFDRYVSELEKRIKRQGENGKIKLRLPIDVKGSLSDEAIYEVKDIKTLIDTAKSTKQTRIDAEKNKTTYQEDLATAKADWEKAKKGYEALLKDQKATSEQVRNARDEMQAKEKSYKDLGGVTDTSKQENQAEKLRQQTEKYNLLLNKQALEQKRAAEDVAIQVEEARIKSLADGSEKTIAQIELNFEKEKKAIDRQQDDILRKKIEDARNAWNTNPANKGKSFDATGIKLSDEEKKQFDNMRKYAIDNNEKAYSELTNQYLLYTDQRIEIEKKFNDDIAILQEARKKAEAKGDTDAVAKIDRSIGKRTETKNEEVYKLDAEQFKKEMNWEQVFGNLDKVSTDTLKKLKANLRDFVSDQKDLAPESLKELVDAIERIDDKVSERNPFEAMSASFKSLKTATDAEREAQEAYNKALKEGTDEEKKNAKATLESTKNNKQKALSEATTALHKGVDEIGQYVESGNQVIGIMETLGVKTPEWLEGAMSGFGEMLNGLEKMDLTKPMSIVTGGLQTIKGALTSVVSLGGLIPGFGGADYSRYNKMKEEYNTLVDIWDTLISKKQQYIDISYGDEARKVGQETLDLLDKKAKSNITLGLERLNAGASIGSHSIGVRQRKGMSKEGWDELRKAAQSIGFDYNSVADGRMTGLFGLTAEQLSKLQDEAPTFWAKLDGDVQEYLQNIIDCNTEIESMKDKLNETMTGVSFDSFYDSFISTLADMDKSSKDMADDFGEYLKTAILSNLVANKYRDKIEALYNDWASKSDSDGDGIFDLTSEESEQLKAAQQALAEQMMAERDAMANAFGWNSGKYSQSSSNGGFQAMSQDTGSELNGRFTALQMAGEEIKNQNALQSQSLNILTMKADAILSANTEMKNIADDTRDLIANSYLELVQISENTGAIVKPIQQMQKDMAEVKKNTSKL